MIMAGGTGGHVFPALAIAGQLRATREIVWLGTERGIEARLVPAAGYPVEWIEVEGLRGKGAARWLGGAGPARSRGPRRRARARQRRRPGVVLGCGGFASGPGRHRGLARGRAARDPRAECGRRPHQPLARALRLAHRRRISRQLPGVAQARSTSATPCGPRSRRCRRRGSASSRATARCGFSCSAAARAPSALNRLRAGGGRAAAGVAPPLGAAPDRREGSRGDGGGLSRRRHPGRRARVHRRHGRRLRECRPRRLARGRLDRRRARGRRCRLDPRAVPRGRRRSPDARMPSGSGA